MDYEPAIVMSLVSASVTILSCPVATYFLPPSLLRALVTDSHSPIGVFVITGKTYLAEIFDASLWTTEFPRLSQSR